jgi:hypothetical protein
MGFSFGRGEHEEMFCCLIYYLFCKICQAEKTAQKTVDKTLPGEMPAALSVSVEGLPDGLFPEPDSEFPATLGCAASQEKCLPLPTGGCQAKFPPCRRILIVCRWKLF